MYKISELAKKVELSRSTLLYYEKIGLISSNRQDNGYRCYSELDLQRVKLLQQLQAGGLTHKECLACLDAKIDREMLLHRLQVLDEEIIQKQKSKKLLSSMLGMNSMRDWHQRVDKHSPSVHLDWLMKQGFSEKQALRLKWLSKDMNEHEQYMADFELIFDGVERLGPGSEYDSLRALKRIPFSSGELLEIGCGKGVTTTILAEHSSFSITGLDNDKYNLSCLNESIALKFLQERVTSICASMTDLPFSDGLFDLIWCEGGAYIMGVEQALKSWKPFIKKEGYLVISDLVWLTDSPDLETQKFWQQGYPEMTNVAHRCQMIEKAGYQVIDNFELSQQAWINYIEPLRVKMSHLTSHHFGSQAFDDLQKEVALHDKQLGQYGYQLFVLQKKGEK